MLIQRDLPVMDMAGLEISVVRVTGEEVVRISGDQFDRMVEAGVWGDRSPIELWNGLLRLRDCRDSITDCAFHGVRHAGSMRRFAQSLRSRGVLTMMEWLPVELNEFSRPEPDFTIRRARDKNDELPTPEDIEMVVECASASLDFDRDERLPAFATAGIARSLLVDLIHDEIVLFEEPSPGDGCYLRQTTYRRGDEMEFSFTSVGRFLVPVDELLPN